MEKISGSKKALHDFLICWEDHLIYSILSTLGEAPRSWLDLVTKEGNNGRANPRFLHLEDKVVFLAPLKYEPEFS